MLRFLPKLRAMTSRVAGFTMIELLIVITILGILAVAVLSAINPLEQINRGRDTATQSDGEQLLNAVERFTAFQEYLPWLEDKTVSTVDYGAIDPMLMVDDSWVAVDNLGAATACQVLDRLGTNANATCTSAANELKESYVDKIISTSSNPERALYLFKATGDTGSNLYVCFQPQSKAFRTKADERCGNDFASTKMPSDLVTDAGDWTALCSECSADTGTNCYSCLP